MTGAILGRTPRRDDSAGSGLFVARWVANPLRMGSVVPSSRSLCARLVQLGWPPAGKALLELGSGTGVIARAFLRAGLPAERLAVVEVDRSLADHLRKTLRGVEVIEGDARAAPDLLPDRLRGRIGDVICGIPLVMLPLPEQRRFIDAMNAAAPGAGFLHYTYCITSPLPARKHGLAGRREAWTPLNFPPASVWRYRPSGQ